LTSSTTPPQLAYICVPPEDAAAGRAPPAAESARWQTLDAYCRALSPAEAGVAARVGLSLGWLGAAARGGAPPRAASAGAASGAAGRPAAEAAADEHRRVARRFWTALALAELLHEAPPAAVAQRFGADAAALRTLRERAARHAAMLAALAERLGWGDLEALLTRFQGRLSHGVRSELLPLMEVPGLKPWAARRLYAAGLRAPEALAAVSSLEQLASVLAAGAPAGPDGADAAHWRQAAARAVRGARELLAARARAMGDAAAAAARAAAGRGGGEDDRSAAPGVADAAVAAAADADAAALCAAAAAASDSVTVAAAGVAAAALEAPPAAEADPGADAWELGELRGAVVLAERCHVSALVALVRARYARFGFVLDIAEPAAAGGAAGALAPPPGPSAARAGARPPPAGAPAATRVEGAAVCWRDGVAFYVPLAVRPDLADALAPLFADAALEKATFDLKSQLAALARAADAARAAAGAGAGAGGASSSSSSTSSAPLLALAGPLVDVRVAAFLATPDDGRLGDGTASAPSAAARVCKDGAPHALVGLAASRLGAAAAAAAAAGMAPPAGAPPGAGRRRHEACRGAALARRAAVALGATLGGLGLARALREVEMPVVPALAALEAAGVCIDAAALRRETAALAARCAALAAAAEALLGAPLDFLSPPDVSAALYETLRLPVPPGAARLKGGGGWSADAKALHWLVGAAGGRCPLPAMIGEYRKLSKASAFADALLALCAVAAPVPGTGGGTFRVRGHVNHTVAVTGRLSMDVPNLTTVPKPTTFPLPGGPPGAGYVHRCALRRALRAPPGCLLLSADFKQLELRMIAHHSGCAALAATFAARDPFEAMAAHWRGLPPGAPVAPADRADAKQLVYALLYGSGAGVVARALGESDEARARRMADAFQARFPGVRAWAAAVRAGAARGRCPPSLAGRTRPLAGGRDRGAPGRFAVNFAGQGSAADVAKLALAALPAALAAAAPPGAARVVLAVHDEFVLEVREEHVSAVAEALRATMVGAPAALGGLQLRVPLEVALKVGPTWGEMATFGGDGAGGAAADADDADDDGAPSALLDGEEEDEGDEAES
jgi:DNA polymerase theta